MTTPETAVSLPPAEEIQTQSSNQVEKKSSWIRAVQNKLELKNHVIEVEVVNGSSTVEIPDDLIQNSVPLWDDFLEGKFLAPAPHVAKIHVIVNKIWPLGDKSIRIDVFSVSETTVKFRIKNAQTRGRVLRRGMWNIADIPMIVSKWSPIIEEAEPEITTIPMWVKLKNVPNKMYSWDGLAFIASTVEKPVRLHPETEQCTSFEEAKVFVNADMTKELPKVYRFKSKMGVDAQVEFVYPWLPSRCTICSKWGHMEKSCKQKGKSETQAKVLTIDTVKILSRADTILEEKQSVPATVSTKNLNMEEAQVSNTEDPLVENEKGNGKPEDGISSDPPTVIGDRVAAEEIWSIVSPAKSGRSTEKVPDTEKSVGSPSRFAVLHEMEGAEDRDDDINEEINTSGKNEESQYVEIEEEKEVEEEAKEEREEGELKHTVEVVDTKIQRGERAIRRPTPRLKKDSNRPEAGKEAPTIREPIPSVSGRRRNSRKP